MAKLRRLFFDSLEHAAPGAELDLPDTEARHARVLRLQPGDGVMLVDAPGRSAAASIIVGADGALRVRIESFTAAPVTATRRLIIGTAWPKGKRAAYLIEKCAELGVNTVVPLSFERSAVQKDNESEGVTRLRRIAAEASKQCGREGVMEIAPEERLSEFLARKPAAILFLDPRAAVSLGEHPALGADGLALIVGPEGGFTAAELGALESAGVEGVRLARHVLRIETAAVAAAAVWECLRGES